MHANTLTTQIKESLPFSILWQARAQNFPESFRVAAKEFCSIHSEYHHDCWKLVFHQSVWWSMTNFPQILHDTRQFLFILTNSFAIAFSFLPISLSFDISKTFLIQVIICLNLVTKTCRVISSHWFPSSSKAKFNIFLCSFLVINGAQLHQMWRSKRLKMAPNMVSPSFNSKLVN